MAISGQLNGGLLLFFPESSATRISCQLLRKQSIEDLLHEPASSTLKEVGNILASAFLASLEQQLGLRSLPAPPEIARATIAQLLKDRQQTGADHCVIVRTRLISNLDETAPLQGAIYLLPQPEALQKLIDKLSAD
jgi:chemotaxis protein CheC